jgi:hypothetical protein
MGLANVIHPVASPHRDNGELGQDDSPWDSSTFLLGTINTQPEVTFVVPNGYKCLEPGALASLSLLLHRHDLQDLMYEGQLPKESQ